MDRLLRLRQICEVLGLGKTQVYAMVKEQRLPEPVRLSHRAVAWRASEVQDFIVSLPRARAEQCTPVHSIRHRTRKIRHRTRK